MTKAPPPERDRLSAPLELRGHGVEDGVATSQALDLLQRIAFHVVCVDLYAHKFRALQRRVDERLDLARRLLAAGHISEAELETGSIEQVLADFTDDLQRSVISVHRIGPVHLSEVVTELATEERVTSERYLEFNHLLLERMPPVRGSGLLKEHLRNLIDNAVQAIERRAASEPQEYKGRISLTAELLPETTNTDRPGCDEVPELKHLVRLGIRDNGLGLDPHVEETVFELGYTTWGSGFGLTAARYYVRALGGDVRANGGEGCIITLELPVFVEDRDNEGKPKHLVGGRHGQKSPNRRGQASSS